MPQKDPLDDIPREREGPRPDFSKPLPRTKLPKAIQETLDDEEKLWEKLYDQPWVCNPLVPVPEPEIQKHVWHGSASKSETDSTDSNIRYAAYAARFRTILTSAHRYVAYTSDIGESFRPVAHPNWIRAAYGVSWLYIGGDVAYEGFKAYKHNQAVLNPMGAMTSMANRGGKFEPIATPEQVNLQAGRVSGLDDYRTVMAQRFAFQSLASMGLPAFTIHSIVRYSGRAMKDVKNKTLRIWGPIGVCLFSSKLQADS
jgi:fission process protein 1